MDLKHGGGFPPKAVVDLITRAEAICRAPPRGVMVNKSEFDE
jgi:hypothetical protein